MYWISVKFTCSVVSSSLQIHELYHTRLPCPSPTPRACLNSYASKWWCHPTISSSVIPFSSCLQSFPASGSFRMSQFLANYLSFSFIISSSSEYSRMISFRIDRLDLFAVHGTLKSIPNQHNSKSINSLVLSFFNSPTLTSIHYNGKKQSFELMDLCQQSNILSC